MDAFNQALADMRGDAQVLRRNKDERVASILETWAERIADASRDLRRFVSEGDAQLYSGKRVPWLRARFAAWAAEGHAYVANGTRFYRIVVLPHRPDLAAAREAGLRGDADAA